jgi:hypothetical protein
MLKACSDAWAGLDIALSYGMGLRLISMITAMLTVTANAGEFAGVGGSVPPPAPRPTYAPPTSQTGSATAPFTHAAPTSFSNSGSPWVPAPPPTQAYVQPSYTNGAGPTGVKWASGGSPGSSADTKKFDSVGAGHCGEGQNIWAAVATVMSENVIPSRKGYDLMASAWPKMSGSQASLKCDFGPNKQSMCTSATAAALCQHFVNLVRENHIQLSAEQIRFLNGPAVKAAINGNTFSVAKLIQHLGGASLYSARSGGVRAVLDKAQTGDILRFDRSNGTGHSAIFKELTATQFCYWTSNTGTRGVGVQCEYLGAISQMVISRFPEDVENLGPRLDEMKTALLGFTSAQANVLGPESVTWASDLDCPSGDKPADRQAALTFDPTTQYFH